MLTARLAHSALGCWFARIAKEIPRSSLCDDRSTVDQQTIMRLPYWGNHHQYHRGGAPNEISRGYCPSRPSIAHVPRRCNVYPISFRGRAPTPPVLRGSSYRAARPISLCTAKEPQQPCVQPPDCGTICGQPGRCTMEPLAGCTC